MAAPRRQIDRAGLSPNIETSQKKEITGLWTYKKGPRAEKYHRILYFYYHSTSAFLRPPPRRWLRYDQAEPLDKRTNADSRDFFIFVTGAKRLYSIRKITISGLFPPNQPLSFGSAPGCSAETS